MRPLQRELRAHVRASNAIEGITVEHGPLYWRHLAAAQAVAADPLRYVYDVAAIHRRMFGGLAHPPQAGRHRSMGAMMVGRHSRHHLPPPHEVPALMELFYQIVALVGKKYPTRRTVLSVHATLLCIHPFADGNRRVSRLHLNAMRLALGFPWLHIRADERRTYYGFIRRMEREFFPLFRAKALVRMVE